MNVCDFDNTIYRGESVLHFFFFYIKKDPYLLKYIPKVFYALFKYKLGKVTVEQALEEYTGTLLFVSHDRYFINKFATRIWEIKDGAISDFKGDYERFRAAEVNAVKQERAKKEVVKKQQKPAKKRGGPSIERQIEKLEREIAKNEEKKRILESQMEEFATDYEKLMELEVELAAISEALDEQYGEWESLSEQEGQ